MFRDLFLELLNLLFTFSVAFPLRSSFDIHFFYFCSDSTSKFTSVQVILNW